MLKHKNKNYIFIFVQIVNFKKDNLIMHYVLFNFSTFKYKGDNKSKGWVSTIERAKRYKTLAAAREELLSSRLFEQGHSIVVSKVKTKVTKTTSLSKTIKVG